jgi:phosphonate transport system substrate-binding protein
MLRHLTIAVDSSFVVRPSFLLLLPLLVFIAGCNDGNSAATEDARELVFIFQKQADPDAIKDNADRVAEYLGREIGIPVRAQVPGDYAASVQALINRKADIAYVSAMPFLLARRDGDATLLLAEQRTDPRGDKRTDYDSIFVVRADSPLQSLDDLAANAGSLRFCFTSSTSTSGYIVPYARLVREGLLQSRQDPASVFRQVTFGGGYTQALEQVATGRADVCAVSDYTMEGPRADVYLNPNQRQQLRILGRTPGVPTHLICARGGLSNELQDRIKAALIKLSDEHPELLADVYGASAFVEVDEDEHVRLAVEAIEYIGLPIEGLAR